MKSQTRGVAPILRETATDTIRVSDSTEEAARIEGIGGIELMLDSSHEGQGVAGSAPGVESGKCGGAVEENEGAVHFFDHRSEILENGSDNFLFALKQDMADSCCLDDGAELDARHGHTAQVSYGTFDRSGQDGNLGEDARHLLYRGHRKEFLTSIPDGVISFGDRRR